MNLKYLIKNKNLLFNARKKNNKIKEIISENYNGLGINFLSSLSTMLFIVSTNFFVKYMTDTFDPTNNSLFTLVGFSSVCFALFLYFVLSYISIKTINKRRIKDKQLYKLISKENILTSVLHKNTVKKLKECFKDITKEELDCLLDDKNNIYFHSNTKKMKKAIFDYARNNKVSKDEQDIIDEIINEYEIDLDEEKLNLLIFKSQQLNQYECITDKILVKKI